MRRGLAALVASLAMIAPAFLQAASLTLHTFQPTHSWRAGVDLTVGADTLIIAGSVAVNGEATFELGTGLNSTWQIYQQKGTTKSLAVFYTTNYDSAVASGHLLDVHCITPNDTLSLTGGPNDNWVRNTANVQFSGALSGIAACHCEPEGRTAVTGALVNEVAISRDSFVVKILPPRYFSAAGVCTYCRGSCAIHPEYGPRTKLRVTLQFVAAELPWTPLTVTAPVGWDSISSQKENAFYTPCFRPGWFDDKFYWYERVFEAPAALIDSVNNYYLGGSQPTPWEFKMKVQDASVYWNTGMVTPAATHQWPRGIGDSSHLPPACDPCGQAIVSWMAADSMIVSAPSNFYTAKFRNDFPGAE